MPELKPYDHLDQISNPDDLTQSKTHDESRVAKLAEQAQIEVNKTQVDGGMEAWFEAENADSARSKIDALITSTQTRVFDVLTQSADNYESNLGTSTSEKLEALAWKHRKGNVLKRIADLKDNTESSLTVTNGYETMLKQAREKTTAEWEQQKVHNQTIIEQMNGWSKFWNQDGKYKAWETGLDVALEKMFKPLEANVAKLKGDAEARIKTISARVEHQWNSTLDPTRKQRLWKQIQAATKSTDLATLKLNAFGIADADIQQKVDFVEAISQMPFLQKGLNAIENSKKLNKLRIETINAGQAEEDYAKKAVNYKFEDVLKKEPFKDLPKQAEQAPSTNQLVEAIENDLRLNAIDLDKLYGKALKASPNPQPAIKLLILSQAIITDTATAEALTITTQQQLVNWIAHKDLATNGGVEGYNQKEVEDSIKELEETGGIFDQLEATVKLAGKVKIDDSTSLGSFYGEAEKTYQNVSAAHAAFNDLKTDFPEADRQKLEPIWQSVLQFSNSLSDKANEWRSQEKAWEKWHKQNTKVQLHCRKEIKRIDDGIDRGVDPKTHGTLIKTRAQLTEASQESLKEEPTLSDLDIRGIGTQVAIWKKADLKKGITSNDPKIKALNARIKDALNEDLKENFEQQFMQDLEASDQFNILSSVSVGTNVQVSFKLLPGTNRLDSPNQLKGGKTDNFRVIQVVENQGVILRALTGGETLVIGGPVVQGGQPYLNAVRKTKTTMHSKGSLAIAYNYKIG